FPPGSMGPKMQAALFFLESGGKEVLITDTINLLAAMRGETGTRIRSNEVSADAADNKDGKLEKNAEVIEKTVKSAAEEEISPDVTPDDTPSPEARV
ncbi:MAG: hypothetical protein JKX97_02820, partial [Candidatus Lindowbacteria bacterium]|nr:hypothetical protein [Candidatus Lindowbacteria bacterium]